MLTTVDNPYDPFTDFTNWYAFDERMGYHTSGMLARILRTSDDLSEADQDAEMDRAIDEIISENVSGIWIKVDAAGNRSMETQ